MIVGIARGSDTAVGGASSAGAGPGEGGENGRLGHTVIAAGTTVGVLGQVRLTGITSRPV